MRRFMACVFVGALATSGGCLPVELSVSPEGRVAIPRQEGFFLMDTTTGVAKLLHKPTDAKPFTAIFTGDGKRVMAISEASEGEGFGRPFVAEVVDAGGGEAKPLFKASNVTYARWSPDAKQASYTRLAGEKVAPLDEALPELHVVQADGATKKLGSNVSALHRWMSDGSGIVIVQLKSKIEESSNYQCSIVKINPADGKTEPLADLIATKEAFFDLSPDGKKVLFTAQSAGKAGAELTEASDDAQLFELDLAAASIRSIRPGVTYAIYSPSGKHVLIATESDQGNSRMVLEVADAGLGSFKPIAKDAAEKAGSGMQATSAYATWVKDDAVLYLSEKAVYGPDGKNLHLIRVKADGTDPTDLQPSIDQAAISAK